MKIFFLEKGCEKSVGKTDLKNRELLRNGKRDFLLFPKIK